MEVVQRGGGAGGVSQRKGRGRGGGGRPPSPPATLLLRQFESRPLPRPAAPYTFWCSVPHSRYVTELIVKGVVFALAIVNTLRTC